MSPRYEGLPEMNWLDFDMDRMRIVMATRRRLLAMTQKQLAEKMDIRQSALSDLETGRNDNPTLLTLRRWAEALGGQVRISVVLS